MIAYSIGKDGGIFHMCRGGSIKAPDLNALVQHGYYEDGYFRGAKRGYTNKSGEISEDNWIRCKRCGKVCLFDDDGTVIDFGE